MMLAQNLKVLTIILAASIFVLDLSLLVFGFTHS